MKQDRPSRFAIRAEETPPDLMEELAKADYSRLPRTAVEVARDTMRRFPKTMKLLSE